MRRATVLLALLLPLAGCAGDAPTLPPSPAPSPPAAEEMRFNPPVRIGAVSDFQGEFPLAVSADGMTILACTHGGFMGPTPKAVSKDGGATWRLLQPEPTPGPAGDCWTHMGSDGTWYFLDSHVGATSVSSSADEGRTWIVNRLTTPPVGGTADRPYLAALGGPRMGISYVNHYLAPGFVAFARTGDRGASWTAPQRVSDADVAHTNVMHGPMLVAWDNSAVRVPLFRFSVLDYPRGGVARGDLGFALSEDAGATWTRQSVASSVEGPFTPPATAIAGDGTLYWAYQVTEGGKQGIRLLTSADEGRTWSAPAIVGDGWDYVGYMWMSGAPDGSALLCFDADAAPLGTGESGEHVILAKLDAAADPPLAWARTVAPASNSEFSTVTIDASGRAHVAYRHQGSWLYLREQDP